MAGTATPIYPQTIQSTCTQLTNATGTSPTQIYSAGANGSKIENIAVTNTDTAAYTLNLYIQIASTNYLIGTINVPASSGNTTSAPSLNLLANSNFLPCNRDGQGNPYLYLAAGAKLMVAVTSTIIAGKTIQFAVQAGDF
jgi:hypothetical protein